MNIIVLGLTNPDVSLKRMHQLYNAESKTGMVSSCILAGIYCDVLVVKVFVLHILTIGIHQLGSI